MPSFFCLGYREQRKEEIFLLALLLIAILLLLYRFTVNRKCYDYIVDRKEYLKTIRKEEEELNRVLIESKESSPNAASYIVAIE